MIEFVVNEIRRLSQEQGLNDGEISQQLGVSRATVNRARSAFEIPRANLENRRDKDYVCNRCEAVTLVPRKERRAKYCPTCKMLIDAENVARKKERYEASRT
jgi:hypothetical protein